MPLLGVQSRELKIHVFTTACTRMFAAATLMIAPKWKQPKHALTDEQIHNMWSKHTMGYHLAINRNETLTRVDDMEEP